MIKHVVCINAQKYSTDVSESGYYDHDIEVVKDVDAEGQPVLNFRYTAKIAAADLYELLAVLDIDPDHSPEFTKYLSAKGYTRYTGIRNPSPSSPEAPTSK